MVKKQGGILKAILGGNMRGHYAGKSHAHKPKKGKGSYSRVNVKEMSPDEFENYCIGIYFKYHCSELKKLSEEDQNCWRCGQEYFYKYILENF